MAIKYGFYNSINNDRLYDAMDFGSLFDGIISDGVFDNIGTMFNVSSTDGMIPNAVYVGVGKAWFNKTWIENTNSLIMYLQEPHASYPRIDAVVLDINSNDAVRRNDIVIVTGEPSSEPVKPVLENIEFHHQYPLAYITRRAGESTISTGDIENAVGTESTPLVTGVLETADISVLIQQWTEDAEAAFEEWKEHLQDELDSNQAANLQRQIDDLISYVQSKIQTITTDINDLRTNVSAVPGLVYRVGTVITSIDPDFHPTDVYEGDWELYAQGRTLVGVDTSDSSFNTVGKTGGEKTHTLTLNESPRHMHNILDTSYGGEGAYIGGRLATGEGWFPHIGDSTSGPNSPILVTNYAGGSASHNNLQPYITVYFWCRVS